MKLASYEVDQGYTSSGCPFFSYIAKKNSGIMITIMPIAARLVLPMLFQAERKTALPQVLPVKNRSAAAWSG
jgi:hypothetical protein